MSCLNTSQKNLKSIDRYSKSQPNLLQETLITELRTRLENTEVKSCENLTAGSSSGENGKFGSSIRKSQSFRSEKTLPKVKKSDSFFMISKGHGTIFGTKLSANEVDPNNKNIPRFLVECFKRIENQLEQTEEVQGIYRVPGEFNKIQKIGRKIAKGDYDYLDSIESVDVLAGAVKLFLRDTKTPLVTSEEIQNFDGLNRDIWCKSSQDEKCKSLTRFFMSLDLIRREVLQYVLRHLKRLCDSYPDKIHSKNFAISIGPAIIHINSKTCMNVVDTLIEHDTLNEYLQFMIDNCFEIFRRLSSDDEYGEHFILETCL